MGSIPSPAGDGDGARKERGGCADAGGEAKSLLDYTCDRCMCRFSREKAVSLRFLLAETLEGEDDDIVLLDQGEVDVGELAYTASFSIWTQNTYAQKTARDLPRLRPST